MRVAQGGATHTLKCPRLLLCLRPCDESERRRACAALAEIESRGARPRIFACFSAGCVLPVVYCSSVPEVLCVAIAGSLLCASLVSKFLIRLLDGKSEIQNRNCRIRCTGCNRRRCRPGVGRVAARRYPLPPRPRAAHIPGRNALSAPRLCSMRAPQGADASIDTKTVRFSVSAASRLRSFVTASRCSFSQVVV